MLCADLQYSVCLCISYIPSGHVGDAKAADASLQISTEQQSASAGSVGAAITVTAENDDNSCDTALSVLSLTQAQLQRACKRVRLSSNGYKSVLASRLEPQRGLKTYASILKCCEEYIASGNQATPIFDDQITQGHAFPFTIGEYYRLICVLCDCANAPILERLLGGPATRAELDRRIDPWDELTMAFNSNDFIATDISFGFEMKMGFVREALEAALKATIHVPRPSQLLKQKYATLRTSMTYVYSTYTASGRNDKEDFPQFGAERLRSDKVMEQSVSFFMCALRGAPGTIERHCRELPRSCAREEGLGL